MRRHLRSTYAVALAIVGRPADAEDVAQEAMILALEKIHTCRDPERFRGWLLQIVRNHGRNWRTRRKLRDVSRDAEAPNEALAPGPGPEGASLRRQLLDALGILSLTEREVVLLHDLDGCTHPEIALALDMSVVMSRQHLFQARRKLRAYLSEPAEEVQS